MKRIVLIDPEETPNYLNYAGVGLKEIYLMNELLSRPEKEIDFILELKEGDAIMLVGSNPFKYIQTKYHLGIRNENYFDCSKLYRLSMEGGAFAMCIADFPSKEMINEFLNPRYTTKRIFNGYNGGVIKTYEEAINFIKYLDNHPIDLPLGFDYEGSGMALDEVFELSGFSLSTETITRFISLTDIRRELRDSSGKLSKNYDNLLNITGNFLERRQKFIWAYNIQYEFQVSHRMLGVDLYNLCDASVFNILRGNHLKPYSLKWTANSILYTNVWDVDFDRLTTWLDSMYFITVGKSKKTREKILRVDPTNYNQTEEWGLICKTYPNYISEFETLIKEYWAMPYMNIPSDILGYYCNLDSFYTLRIFLEEKDNYSEVARETFLDNIRLGARLHSCGMYKDEDFRLGYKDECEKMMAWGITNSAISRCSLKMKKHYRGMAKLSSYSPTCQLLIKRGNFYNGNSLNICKFLLIDNLDELDTNDIGLNEGKLLLEYGSDFAIAFIDIVKDAMVEVKMKTKIDSSITRKRKILGIISDKLLDLLEIRDLEISEKHLKLEKYLYYERSYKELSRVIKTVFNNDIELMPSSRNTKIKAFSEEFDMLSYSTYVSNNYFKCKSHIENDEIAKEYATLFKLETAWLAAIFESTQQLNDSEKFYKNLNIDDPNEGFNHFMSEWEDYCKHVNREYSYPDKVFQLALRYWRDITLDGPKEIWTNFNGFTAQAQFFPKVKSECKLYGLPVKNEDLVDKFFFMRKFVINYLLYKKYAKVLSTYIDGLFYKTDISVIENPITRIPIRKALPNEPGAVTKMFARYEVNTKSSKRWSSGYHTIVSHSDLKSTINTPPGCLLTYFDISSAEVKSAGFASGDPDLIDKFVNNIDIYVYTGKLYLPDGPWDTDPAFRGMWRKRFKTIFLGILYGLGKKSLAERLNSTEEEAERIIEATYKAFPKLREYVKSQQRYPFENNGYVNTFFGDKLQVEEWKYYLSAKSERERTSIKSRIERLGVNLPIQGGTSSAMAAGFFNGVRQSIKEDWVLNPIIVVHDSNTNYIPISKLFEIREFYDKNFTDFCYKSTNIKLLFDLLCGTDYETACEMKQLDSNNIKFSGNAHSLLKIVDKVMECPNINIKCSMSRDELKPAYVTHPIERFIREKGTSVILDNSWYSIILTKL